jgi:hypothetical protein
MNSKDQDFWDDFHELLKIPKDEIRFELAFDIG